MKFVRVIDKNGMFIEDAFVEELTEFTIDAPCPSGFYTPKWNGEEWVEGATQEYIDSLQASPQEPSIEDRINALEMMELERLFGGM